MDNNIAPNFTSAPTPMVSVTVDPSSQPPPHECPPAATEGQPSERPPESVKMFVGQVPKHFQEKDLREHIESYAPIETVTILRDRATGLHRGCAFVTYASKEIAEQAQARLHNKITLPTMMRELQVNTAGTKTEEMKKVFVGMLGTLEEQDVRRLFKPYGPIDDVTMLKDKEGNTRRCAFVKFASRDNAQKAISEMHQSEIMPGSNAPLVVKYADNEKERQARKMQKAMQQLSQMQITAAAATHPFQFGFAPSQQPSLQLLYATQLMQQQSPMIAPMPHPLSAYSPGPPHPLLSPTSPTHGGGSQMTSGTPPVGTSGMASPSLTHAIGPLTAPSLPPPNGISSTTEPIQSPLHSPIHGYSDLQTASQFGMYQYTTNPFGMQSPTPSPQKEGCGPEGCNLFIYHLPADYGDQDLYSLFSPYGNIVSAKVFIDKQTKQSKCFGFVSYDQSESASFAIRAMNGFAVGTKRLKVEHKKPKVQDTKNK